MDDNDWRRLGKITHGHLNEPLPDGSWSDDDEQQVDAPLYPGRRPKGSTNRADTARGRVIKAAIGRTLTESRARMRLHRPVATEAEGEEEEEDDEAQGARRRRVAARQDDDDAEEAEQEQS